MALKVSRVDVWAAGLKDRPGQLAAKLAALAEAGANVQFVVARRAPDKPGTGVVFVTPLKGAKQLAAAKKAGFMRARSLRSVRVEGPDKRGIGAKLAHALADAGINLRGLSAAALGKKFVCYLALDKAADATRAIRVLKKV
ncbi:MAG: ACT domain-containing protein [Planctomycetota bacterium]